MTLSYRKQIALSNIQKKHKCNTHSSKAAQNMKVKT